MKVDGSQVIVCIFEPGEFYRIAIARAMGAAQNQPATGAAQNQPDMSFQSARLTYADLQTRARDIVPLDPPARDIDDAYERANCGLFHTRDPTKDYKGFVKIADGSNLWVPLDTHVRLSWS